MAPEAATGTVILCDPADLPERPSRILIAENDHLVAADLTAVLADLGYTSLHAGDGASAVELARSGAPDLALVDIKMPGRDGLRAAAELYFNLGIPVVILSAYCDDDLLRGAQEAGVFGYLVKPVRPEQLRAGLAMAWGRYKLFCDERHRNRLLRGRLEDRRVIERAKWALVRTSGVPEPEAMRILQKRARAARLPLADMAEQVLRETGMD